MTLSVDLFFSFRSPYSYLALPKTLKLVADYDATVNLRPVYPLAVREEARTTLTSRKAGGTPHYAWSIADNDLEARILEVLSWAHLRAGDPAAALDAIERACGIAPSRNRGIQRAAILCDHFPDRHEEAMAASVCVQSPMCRN